MGPEMRKSLFGALASLLLVAPVSAQVPELKKRQIDGEERIPPKVEAVIGFKPYGRREVMNCYKVGQWAPVYIDVLAGTDDLPPGVITIEAVDNEGVPTRYTVPSPMIKRKTRQTLLGFTKPGNAHAEIKIVYEMPEWRKIETTAYNAGALDLNSHLYLTLGKRLPELQDAIIAMAKNKGNVNQIELEGYPRYGAYEVDYNRLPDQWFGYQAIDLMIFPTADRGLLERLVAERDSSKLKAIAQWVRRGGRLVISVHWNNADTIADMLEKPAAWQPPVPVVPPRDQRNVKDNAVKSPLNEVMTFAGAFKNFPADPARPVLLAQLGKDDAQWEVLARTKEGQPVITRMPYGMGSIVFVAFNLDEGAFTQWEGRVEFLQQLINRFGPRVHTGLDAWQMRGGGRDDQDLSTQLHREQDKFDVTVVSFGWVALFILLYIVVVGPLDYILLKKVFKRLEWTWVTFPSVVILVSAVAYFTAYAIKGNDLKINKVDIIDIDQRTELTAGQKTKKAYAYGHSFFTILSPRIQNYTVGIEPAVPYWMGVPVPEDPEKRPAADMMSWMGRAEWYSMGRTTGLFRRPYDYAIEAGGVKGVPISVWTTKAFVASWESELPKPPIQADLLYHQAAERALRVSGTLQNNLPIDLDDVWLLYRNQAYLLSPTLKAGAPAQKIALELNANTKSIGDWVGMFREEDVVQPMVAQRGNQGNNYNPSPLIRQILFQEKLSGQQTHNHLLRPLDLSWRLQEDRATRDTATREVILLARARRQIGTAAELSQGKLPTYLWLDHLPREQKERSLPAGLLVQDTYFRIILPARPGD